MNLNYFRIEVAMMQAKLELQVGYSTELEARTLELPLVSRRMSFFVVLPDYIGKTSLMFS